MQMRSLGKAGIARAADLLALHDIVADLDANLAQVCVDRRETVVVHDLDHLAHAAAGIVARVLDHAVGGCDYLGADAGAQIDAAMQACALDHRVFTHTELACDFGPLQR